MSRADEYRVRAAEAEKRAGQVRDAEARRIYQDIARQWRDMAEQAARHGLD